MTFLVWLYKSQDFARTHQHFAQLQNSVTATFITSGQQLVYPHPGASPPPNPSVSDCQHIADPPPPFVTDVFVWLSPLPVFSVSQPLAGNYHFLTKKKKILVLFFTKLSFIRVSRSGKFHIP